MIRLYGFRLPAAMDNRPLKYEEFEYIQNQVIYVSATPSDYELLKTEGIFRINMAYRNFIISSCHYMGINPNTYRDFWM